MTTRRRRRFTLTRLLGSSLTGVVGAVTFIGAALAVAAPKVAERMQHGRLDQAGETVVGDLRLASTIAAESRKPVRLVVRGARSAPTGYAIYDRSGAVRQERSFGSASPLGVGAVAFSTDTVEFYPNGVTSYPLTVTLSAGTAAGSRQVTMARAGTVEIQ